MTQDNTEFDELKVGREISARNAAKIQAAHDALTELGAACALPGLTTLDVPKSLDDGQLVFHGAEVKALGEGRVGGYLVRFTSDADPDLTGDFFTAKTDFGDAATSPVYYHHGLDSRVGKAKLGKAELRTDEVGVWAEAQLQMANEYQQAIYQLAEQGKLGWSSGTASHLVEREMQGKAAWIKSWPLGLDASLTPTPAEPRNSAQTLKSLLPEPEPEPEVKAAEVPPEPIQPEIIAVKEITHMDDNLKSEILALLDEKMPAQFKSAPAVLKQGRGDTEAQAVKAFIKSGDTGGLRNVPGITVDGQEVEFKASNATDMNETTAADGADAVPTGMAARIIARRDENALYSKLGMQNIPGVGKAVDVPYDNEADGEFISTAESATYDIDSPAIAKKTFTLAKYTKNVPITEELLEDTPVALEAFLANFVGRGAAKTENSLFITEAIASGTSLKTFASATVYATGELEAIPFGTDIANYLDSPNVAWITCPGNYSKIAALGSTSLRWYGSQAQGVIDGNRPTILGYPVFFTGKVDAAAASKKSIFFGDWSQVGRRGTAGFTLLRDPYSDAKKGWVNLLFGFRVAYGVLVAEAVGYGVHPSA